MKRVLTVSEINQMLINKGYKSGWVFSISTENSWGADTLSFNESKDGTSYFGLYKFHQSKECLTGCGNLQRLANYRKLKAAEKYEIIEIVTQLPKYENKN